MASVDVIKQGQNVILKKGKNLRLYQVWRKRKVHLDKKHFYLDEAIGQPYGTTWEVYGAGIQLHVIRPDNSGQDTKEGGIDNRRLNDDRRAQKLSDVDIRALRNQGKQGQEIVEQLVENSTSFKEKTVYSQAKYLKRKRDKHVMHFQILRPNTMLLCEMYGTRAPSKNIHLRIDTLAQVLTYANVQSGVNVMMIETCQGLLVGAIMERMAGKGTIVQIHSENVPVRLAVDAYNFPASYKDMLQSYPLDQLYLLEMKSPKSGSRQSLSSDSGPDQGFSKDIEDRGVRNNSMEVQESSESVATPVPDTASLLRDTNEMLERLPSAEQSKNACSGEDKATDRQFGEALTEGRKRKFQVNPEKEARKQKRRENLNRVGGLLKNAKMDALVMACRFLPLPIFKSLFKFLAPSRPFVVYCHYIEPLMECNEWLRDSGEAINIKVTETWFREYQVLPERTHPHVNMSGTGGYLLTGTTVSNT